MGRLAARFRRLDAYAKTLDDVRIKTLTGGLLTVAAAALVAVLVGLEFAAFRRVELQPELVVDRERSETMRINLDITLPRAPCVLLGLDVLDAAGEAQINLFQHVATERLAPNGTALGEYSAAAARQHVAAPPATAADGQAYCGSCYGGVAPEGGCCNSCDDVHQAYVRRGWAFSDPDSIEQCVREGYTARMRAMAGEGCRMRGFIEVGKVAGNFHILAGESIKYAGEHTHAQYDYMPRDYDLSHTINRLSFGSGFSAQSSPLDGVSKRADDAHTQFKYFTKIVGSEVRYRNGSVLQSNQYSATEFVGSGARRTPGLFVMFDISPMRVVYTEHRRSLGSFLTSVCAIVGAVAAVARLADACAFRAERALQQKRQIGKLI
ncbi:ER-derived vesicles protein erv46 [Coemansia sp. RSA 2711]|nr:ER-derived vesicles protein erv46 [Coemansia sp. RSA 2711]KAJ2317805.1 ER-derived vesicles protein erv46 [Coemansia sp. RSA 2704]KAJ2323450.1 ER-derived vesicles protein erv46 [Coemansia sp. RSA 2702]